MSVEVAHATHGHEEHEGHEPYLCHQYEDRGQQDESYVVGMWTFLVTEIMFFGALFLAYTIYRTSNSYVFEEASRYLNKLYGGTNTVVLLTSSFTMALAVYNAQLYSAEPSAMRRKLQLLFIGLTVLLSFTFLGIKAVEWTAEFKEYHLPGPTFQFKTESGPPVTKDFQDKAQMFFCLYFTMTGLHAIHVIIGILIMGVLMLMIQRRHPAVQYYMPVEMTGLYWHFVDIVWIFLFPLYYLIPKISKAG